MNLKHRRKRPLDRKAHVRSADLIVIATEGEHTERQYFSMFHNTRVQVVVMGAEDGKSSSQHTLARLDEYKEEYQIGEGDTLWLMIDVDRWKEKKLNGVTQEAHQKGYGLAVSNPSFECWLHLHFADIPSDAKSQRQIVESLKAHLGGSYNKANLDVEKFKGRESEAVQRAKTLAEAAPPGERWPSKTGTHVYKVVEKLI